MLKPLRITISKRIYLSFLVLIIAFGTNAVVTYFVVKKNTLLTNKIFQNSNPSLQNLERFKLLVNESKMFTTNWVFLPAKSSDKNQLLKLHNEYYPQQKNKLTQLAVQWPAAQHDSLKAIFSYFEKLLLIEKQIITTLHNFEDYEDPIKKMESEYQVEDMVLPITQELLKNTNQLIEVKKREIDADEKELLGLIKSLRTLVITLAIILIMLALTFSIYTSYIISKPIVKIKNIINNLGLGIIKEIPNRRQKDEIGDMITSVNNLSKSLQYTSQFATEIGEGNFNSTFAPLSEQDTLGKSLLTMRDNLQKTKLRLLEAQELTSNGSWEFDIETRQLEISEISRKIIGWDMNDTEPKIYDYIKIIHTEDVPLHLDRIEKATKFGLPQTYDLRIKLKNGSIKNIQKIVKPIFDNEGKVVKLFGTILDIDQRKKSEEELILAKEAAEQATRVKSQFLSNMSHEMRTPMNAIIGLSDLLVDEKLEATVHEKVSSIKNSGENLLKIINEILDFSKIEAGKITLESIDFDIRNVLDGVAKTLDFKAESKGLKFKIVIDENIPDVITGDPYRLNQILLNLAGNAIKFTQKGYVSIELKPLEINLNEVLIEFAVIDTGIGIATDKQQMIFESFNQAQNDHSRKYGGTGLGLSITKKLIELIGGHLELNSIAEKGSTFSFKLKYKIGERKKAVEQRIILHPEKLDGMSILLVEDNVMNQFVVTQILKKWKVVVEPVLNGRIAIEVLEKKNFDLILMDLQMPEMDGYEATRVIRDKMSSVLNHDVPIIGVSADAFEQTRKDALIAGMNGFITKPIDKNELHKNLQEIKIQTSRKVKGTIQPATYSELINFRHLTQIADRNDELILEMLKLYLMELPSMMLEMRNNASELNWYAIIKTTARMQSIVNNLGLLHAKSQIFEIEKLCLDLKQPDMLVSRIEELALHFQSIYEQLHAYIKRMEASV